MTESIPGKEDDMVEMRECCPGTCKTHRAVSRDGEVTLLCTRHAAFLAQFEGATISRLVRT